MQSRNARVSQHSKANFSATAFLFQATPSQARKPQDHQCPQPHVSQFRAPCLGRFFVFLQPVAKKVSIPATPHRIMNGPEIASVSGVNLQGSGFLRTALVQVSSVFPQSTPKPKTHFMQTLLNPEGPERLASSPLRSFVWPIEGIWRGGVGSGALTHPLLPAAPTPPAIRVPGRN